MNSYFKYLFYGIAAVILSSGCLREDLEEGTGAEIRLTAGVDGQVVSKAPAEGIYPEDDEDLEISLFRWDEEDTPWPADDALSGTLGSFVSSSSGVGREIKFDIPQYYTGRTSSTGFIGIYPELSPGTGNSGWQNADNGYLDGGKLTYLIDGHTDVMITDFMSGTQEQGIKPLPFRHALCMYKFYVYAVDENSKAEWQNLKEVNIANLPESLIVSLPEAVQGSAPSFASGAYPANSAEDMIPLSEFSDLLDGEYELQVGLPADLSQRYVGTILGGQPKNGILGMSVEAVGAEDLNSVSIARDFQPGYTYNIVLRFSSSGIINADVTVENWNYDSSDYNVESSSSFYHDLSRYGTSNCYVVSSANMNYCFDAGMKGNGVSEITSERLGVTIPLLGENPVIDLSKAASVKVLRWDALMKKAADGTMSVITDLEERKNTEIIDRSSVVLRDGKILFKVPGAEDPDDHSLQTEGNVKIGLLDADGNIIWSWHIWVTDTPLNQNYLNGYVAMDRNLGAAVSSKSESSWNAVGDISSANAEFAYGLYYQFGRKDPMFIPSLYQGDEYVSSAMAADIYEAHRNPMKFYYDAGGSGNWLAEGNTDHLWGYISQRDEYVKTMYDPCPPGYRISGKEIWEQHGNYSTVSDSCGSVMSMGDDGNGSVYYPTSHLIHNGVSASNDNEDKSGNYTYLLSATPIEDTDKACHFRLQDSDTYPLTVPQTVSEDKDVYRTGRATAYPVRCVFETSGRIVTDLSEAQTANSYIISKTGFYKFKANVRGNGIYRLSVYTDSGSTTLSLSDIDGDASSMSPDRIDLLWWQGSIENGSKFRTFVSGYDGSDPDAIEAECPVRILDGGSIDRDGYATVYVNADRYGPGNVGIAAFDSSNKILWSWHFWIVQDMENIKVGNYTLMDRNIGATMAPKSRDEVNQGNILSTIGFYYQWGRKDPFFPSESYSGNSSNSSSVWLHKDPWNGWSVENSLKQMSGPVTLTESAENPLSFSAVNQNDWQNTFTGLQDQRNNLWGYTGRAAAIGNAYAKTMYDPCPPGYRIMPHNVVGENPGPGPAYICNPENSDKENYITELGGGDTSKGFGFYLTSDCRTQYGGSNYVDLEGGNGLWLPLSGKIGTDGTYTGLYDTGYWSTATPFTSSTGDRNCREIEWTWKKDVYVGYPDWWKDRYIITQQNSGNYMTEGRPVRCLKE